jgi:RNA polymerase sigma-70 factor (ECF subfamily)
VVARRQARALLGPREPSLDAAAPSAESLEAGLVTRTHAAHVRDVLRAAIAELPERAREALRLEVVEGLPHHEIAELWHVHRTTVVRWIEDARTAIAASVRRALRRELAIGPATADSLLRSFAGLDVSLASVLHRPG